MKPATCEEANEEASKLDCLADICGFSVGEFMDEYYVAYAVPGICMNPHCDFTAEVEPDQCEGWCEECETASVRSGISLAGLI